MHKLRSEGGEMRTYIAFHKNKKIVVEADTSYEAQTVAAQLLKVKPNKRYEVTVMLADVVHDGAVL